VLIKKRRDIPYSEVTPKNVYLDRRRFLIGAAAAGAAVAAYGPVSNWFTPPRVAAQARGRRLPGVVKSSYTVSDKQTPYEWATTYNNYYEFSTDKEQPAVLAKNFRTSPWTVTVDGHVAKPGKFSVDDLMKLATLEERIYRFRCVEGWSMIVPWIGFPLSNLIKRVEPTSRAKYMQFFTALDPAQMPGLSRGGLDWPYREGLRMDEAMHPLAILCFGLYGEVLPNQNGAPMRTVIPWKYGFKTTKSIVRVTFVESEPATSWSTQNPREYGFYSNVNPEVHHPRWSQAMERRLGEFGKRPTLMFNGYGDQVANLYSGMDLRKFY
jgi:sulfoxide reductase catalytic subunit YedY